MSRFIKRLKKCGLNGVSALFFIVPGFLCFCLYGADSNEIEKSMGKAALEAKDERKALISEYNKFIKEAQGLISKDKYFEASKKCIAAEKKLESITGPYAELKREQLKKFEARLKRMWAARLFSDARNAFLEKRYDEAIELALSSERINPALEKDVKQFVENCKKYTKANVYNNETNLLTIDPDNDIRKEDIALLIKEAELFYKNKEYGKAKESLEKALIRDPYNTKANYLLEKVYRNVYDVGKKRREAEILERVSEVEWKWNEAVLPTKSIKPKETGPLKKDESKSGIYEKLNKIIIDKVEFEGAGISTVITRLADKSKQCDPEGVGLRMALQPGNDTRITMNFYEMPIGEVIRYLCQETGLKYRIEDKSVLIGKNIDEMETRFFKVRAELMAGITGGGGGEGGGGDTGAFEGEDILNTEDTLKAGPQKKTTATSEALKKYFSDRGVPFEEGTAIAYDKRTGRLIVTNTLDNLRKFEDLLRQLDITKPMVLIEAKILEIAQTDMEELGFDWVFRGGGVRYDDQRMTDILNAFNNGQITASGRDTAYSKQIKEPSWQVAGTEKILRSFSSLTNINSTSTNTGYKLIDAMKVLPNFGPDNAFDLFLTVNAIDQSGRAEVLSAPKVIASSGTQATIRMVREMYFPESWTEPEISISDSTISYTPSYPEFGDPTDIGIRFEVTPTVFSNNYTIMLELNPQVISLSNWTDYSYQVVVGNQNATALLVMPEISRRDLVTKVKVFDGETVVLGGILEDKSWERNDRWPGLGEIPLAGRLFASEFERTQKTNLMIFVTSRLISNDGVPVRRNILRGLPEFNR